VQKIKLTLIGTSHCHLCVEAALIVEDAIKLIGIEDKVFTLNQVDIIDNVHLYERYAIKIPVLRIQENQIDKLIFWPFAKQDVINLIMSIKS